METKKLNSKGLRHAKNLVKKIHEICSKYEPDIHHLSCSEDEVNFAAGEIAYKQMHKEYRITAEAFLATQGVNLTDNQTIKVFPHLIMDEGKRKTVSIVVENKRYENTAKRYRTETIYEIDPLKQTIDVHVNPLTLFAVKIINDIKYHLEHEPFNLDDSLLREYPEMQVLSGIKRKDMPDDTLTVSAAYTYLRAAERNLPTIEEKRPTASIEYLLKLAKESLDDLTAIGKYDRFIATEKQKLEEITSKASELIGNKVRIESEGVYR